jgi:hypothetical protein
MLLSEALKISDCVITTAFGDEWEFFRVEGEVFCRRAGAYLDAIFHPIHWNNFDYDKYNHVIDYLERPLFEESVATEIEISLDELEFHVNFLDDKAAPEPKSEVAPSKCTCDWITQVLPYGCKCGGK